MLISCQAMSDMKNDLIIINLYLLLPATCWYLWHKNNSINRVFFDCNQSLCFSSHSFIYKFFFRIIFRGFTTYFDPTLFFWGKDEKKSVGKMKKQKMSVISVFKGEVRLTDERHTIGTNKKLVVDLINQEKNRSSLWGQSLFEIAL